MIDDNQFTPNVSLSIPPVDPLKVNNTILKKVEIIVASLAAVENLSTAEKLIERQYGIPTGTQRRWKTELRLLFSLPARASLVSIAFHPQLRPALTYVIARKAPSDKGTLRSGKNLAVTYQGGQRSVVDFLSAMYVQQNYNATETFMILQGMCKEGLVLRLPSFEPCIAKNLPSLGTVRRFLRKVRRDTSLEKPLTGSINPRIESVLRGNAEIVLKSVVDACKHIHKVLGSKHREIIYHRAIEKELIFRSIPFQHEAESPIPYRGIVIGKDRVDFLIGQNLILEVKAKKELLREDKRQAKSYAKNLQREVCLLVNFGSRRLQIVKVAQNK